MRDQQTVLSWLHIGDLHLTTASEENYGYLKRIVACIEDLPKGSLDFTVLPGDNADDGIAEQFELVRDAIAPLTLPIHILTGDHDFKPGSLQAFYDVLSARPLPYAIRIAGTRCLFLDVVSAGTGGPDFRLSADQLAWTEKELREACDAQENAVVFMHTYPSDLREGTDQLNRLLAKSHVLCVDMGHTHYNEIANDGRTIFTATRSTGQIEEGLVGFSISAVDNGVVSWRFKSLDEAWPFVLVTTPADQRLVIETQKPLGANVPVRAKVFGDAPIERVELQVDDGTWRAMAPVPTETALWQAYVDRPSRSLRVRVRDTCDRTDEDQIDVRRADNIQTVRYGNGSDQDRIAAWPVKGILGTQLGPNRNGKKW